MPTLYANRWTNLDTLDLDGPGQRSEEGQRSGWGKAGVHSTRERAHDKRGPGSPAWRPLERQLEADDRRK